MRTFGEAPPEEPGLFARLKKGLAKSTAGLGGSLTGLFTKKKLTPRPSRNWKKR